MRRLHSSSGAASADILHRGPQVHGGRLCMALSVNLADVCIVQNAESSTTVPEATDLLILCLHFAHPLTHPPTCLLRLLVSLHLRLGGLRLHIILCGIV